MWVGGGGVGWWRVWDCVPEGRARLDDDGARAAAVSVMSLRLYERIGRTTRQGDGPAMAGEGVPGVG